MSIQEIHERMARGWTFAEARMGKGWQSKYPNVANWGGGYALASSDASWKINLQAHCGSEFPGSHTTTYILAETEVTHSSEQDIYQVVDEFIKTWNEEHGAEAIQKFIRGWIGEANWESCYPYIADWINRGRRHCISITFNRVTHKSCTKAWLYDKPSNTETILFEQEVEGMTEHEVLEMLDKAIRDWIDQHEIRSL